MSTTSRVIAGDTFATISRKQYGTEQEADRIARANPGAAEPLAAGTSLIIPVWAEAPQDVPQQGEASDADEVAVLIDSERFRFWDKVRVVRSIDAMDLIEFGAPFDASLPSFREAFRPFSYKGLTVTIGGAPLFTGTMVSINPTLENKQRIIAVSGYALPGVLNDCTPPASAFPLEFDNQGLRDIAKALVKPFGLSVEFEGSQGAVFERVACEPGKKVLAFLVELAKQRNFVVSSTSRGALLFQQSVETGNPVARLQQGDSPLLSVAPTFSPQAYYSHITGMENVVLGLAGSQYTVKNERLKTVTRPLTFKAPDTLDADIKGATEAKAGRMFGNAVAYSIRVTTWRDPLGNLWTPNTTLTLLAPDAMVYNEYEFVIRSVVYEKDSKTKTATLNLVIPGAFSGKVPEVLPWDD